MTPDGRVVWWRDDTGDERGRWVAAPFEGGEAAPLGPEAAKGRCRRHLVRRRHHRAGHGDRRGLPGHRGGARVRPQGPASEPEPARGGEAGSARFGRHSRQTDGSCASATRSTATSSIKPSWWWTRRTAPWSRSSWTLARTWIRSRGVRVPGDDRLLFTSELGAFERPALWSPRTGDRRDLHRRPARERRSRSGGGRRRRRYWYGTSSRERSSSTGWIRTAGRPPWSPLRPARSMTRPFARTVRCGSSRATACIRRAW